MRILALCGLLVCLVGCYRYETRPVPTVEAEFHATKARITMRDGRVIRMERAYVRSDSLRTDTPFNGSPRAVALGDVGQLQVGAFSRRKTILGTLIATEVALVGMYVMFLVTDPS